MAGTQVSGKNGLVKVNDVTIVNVRRWNFTPTSDNKQYADSSTPGQIKRVAGNKDCSGSFEVYSEDNRPDTSLREGDSVTLKLYSNATDFWTVPALIDSIVAGCDIEGAEIVGATVNFSGNGAITAP